MRQSGLFGNMLFPKGPFFIITKRKEKLIMMKFCPYCGTELVSEEAAFCMGCGNKLPSRNEKQSKSVQYESEDIMEMYAEGKEPETVYAEEGYRDKEVKKNYNPPVRKRRKVKDDYDGYYDDVVPYDKGRVREDNILDMAKKVFIIVIAALLIVAVCVVMMYIL